MFEKIDTGIFASAAPLSGTVRAGRTLRSAHIAKNPQTGELVTGDIKEQTRQVLLNLQQALQAAGGNLKDVVQLQAYLSYKADVEGFNHVYREFFSAPYPVRATLVADLLSPGIRLEIIVTAVLGASDDLRNTASSLVSR